jgi:hypothetical protein
MKEPYGEGLASHTGPESCDGPAQSKTLSMCVAPNVFPVFYLQNFVHTKRQPGAERRGGKKQKNLKGDFSIRP